MKAAALSNLPRRGRPRKGTVAAGTAVRSVRFQPEVWAQFDARAEREGKASHAAMREAVLVWLRS